MKSPSTFSAPSTPPCRSPSHFDPPPHALSIVSFLKSYRSRQFFPCTNTFGYPLLVVIPKSSPAPPPTLFLPLSFQSPPPTHPQATADLGNWELGVVGGDDSG
ncbi:hypothetical protein MUK42_35531 [Musa troglodytarum]|uniref:Uncharacterized protein n=1 Tax=Musa troglodytarum TaxID=320322 RepID=A0A9E7H375_9LILI|nr:hypothetical protein MUK42_35531 [Musa troglodytarum]URE26726.1 hypothetical protein MUK42_35531 [Musa troglodytarum]